MLLIAGSALCALIVDAAILYHPGIPAYRHDWQWPAYGELLRSFCEAKLDAWNWIGRGGPNLGLQLHPYYFLIAALSFALQSKPILVLIVGLCVLFSALGTSMLARLLLGVDDIAAILAGWVFALSPFMLNQLVAGHVDIVAACSALPWALFGAKSISRSGPWTFAFALAWTALHVQFFAFTAVLALLLCGLKPFTNAWRQLLICLATTLPSMWVLVHSSAIEQTMRTTPPWLISQSSYLREALTGAHYFTHYWDTAVRNIPGAGLSQWIYPLAITACLLFRRIFGIRLAIVFLGAVLVLWGLHGPLGGVFASLTSRYTFFSGFRELYHVAIVIAMAGALATASMVSLLPRPFCLAVAGAICVLLSAPFLGNAVFSQTGSLATDSQVWKALTVASHSPVLTRIILPPGFAPMGPVDNSAGGADPLAFRIGNVFPVWQYLPTGPGPYMIWTFQGGGRAATELAVTMGASYELDRQQLESKIYRGIPYVLRYRAHEFSAAPPPPTDWRASYTTPRVKLWQSPRFNSMLRLIKTNLQTEKVSKRAGTLELIHGDNPFTAWVPAVDWWFLDPRISEASVDGGVTFAQRSVLRYHDLQRRVPAWFRLRQINVFRGKPTSALDSILRISNTGIETSAPRDAILVANPSSSANLSDVRGIGRVDSVPLGRMTLRHDVIEAQVLEGCIDCSIVFSVPWNPDWRLVVDGRSVQPKKACCQDVLMTWPVSVKPYSSIMLTYRPQKIATGLESLSAIAWAWLFVALMPGPMRRTKSMLMLKDALNRWLHTAQKLV